jgi:hypothetical protein
VPFCACRQAKKQSYLGGVEAKREQELALSTKQGRNKKPVNIMNIESMAEPAQSKFGNFSLQRFS